VAVYPFEVSKICKTDLLLTFPVNLDGKSHTCASRACLTKIFPILPPTLQRKKKKKTKRVRKIAVFRANPSFFLLSFYAFLFISSAFGSSLLHHTRRSLGNNFSSFDISVFFFFETFFFFVFCNNLCCKVMFFPVVFYVIEVFVGREYGGVVQWNTRRSLAEGSAGNSSLILVETRTYMKDPLDGFNRYNGGWNISNQHY
jgi:hypothetical protein